LTRHRWIAAVAIGAAVVASGPIRAPAEDAHVYRVGLLMPGPYVGFGAPLEQDFAKRGYVVGKNIAFERRDANWQLAGLPALMAELVAAKVDVVITRSYPVALAAKEHGGGIPVVVTEAGDPVGTGLVASVARPGGAVTGVSEIATELAAKRLQLLKDTVPSVRSVAVLWNLDDTAMTLRYRAAEAEAPKLGISIVAEGVRAPDDFGAAFAAMTKNPPDAILMVADPLTVFNRQKIIDFAIAHRIPSVFEQQAFAQDGGFMSYGPNEDETLDRAVALADRILRGAKPAELPLELPTRFAFAINLKTAKAIGMSVPESALSRADEVIE
jgi:putative ABC transport system substrate-binding protein